MVNNKFVKSRVDALCRIDATKIANYLLNTKYLTRILKFFPQWNTPHMSPCRRGYADKCMEAIHVIKSFINFRYGKDML